jgi:hypothetical protein
MANDTTRYLRRLFNKGEAVCYTNDVLGANVVTLESALDLYTPANFVSINPLHTRRLDTNVTAHRNLLFEFDKGSLEEQLQELISKQMPYTSLVYSGGKSVHAIIALETEVTPEEYAQLFRYIRYIFWNSDPTSKNPSRLTRVAGAVRADSGKEQELIDLRKRVHPDRVYKWLSHFAKHIERCEEREAEEAARREEARQAKVAQLANGVTGLTLVDPMTLKFLSGEIGTKGSRHARLVAAAHELHDCGVEYDEALLLLEKAADVQGITADPKRLREAEQVANYVYGMRRRHR